MAYNDEKVIRGDYSDLIEGFLYALFNSYVSGYYLDLRERRYYAIGQERTYSNLYDTQGDWSRFDDYIRANIHPEDQDELYELSRIEYIKKRLQRELSFSMEVRDLTTGNERWFSYTVVRGADEDHAAITFRDISEEVNRRQELNRLNRLVREELELNKTIGVYSWRVMVDENNNMRYVDWDENTCEFLGIPYVPGRHESMKTVYRMIHPDLLPAFIIELQKTIMDPTEKHVFSFINKSESDHGGIRWFHLSGRMFSQPYRKERVFIGAFTNVTDTYQFKEEQRELREVRDLMQAARWTVGFDYTGNIEWVDFSDQVRFMLGYTSEEDFPNDMDLWRSLVHPDDAEKRQEAMDNAVHDIKGNTEYDINFRLRHKDGEYLWIRSAMRIHRDDVGHAESAVGVIVDINDSILRSQAESRLRDAYEEQNAQLEEITALNTLLQEKQTKLEESMTEQEAQLEEIVSLNEMLRSNQEELERAVGMARNASTAKSDFLSKMSHDMRTPMNIIVGMTEIARKHLDDTERVRECLDTINMESRQLQTLINDVLDISAIESGKFKIKHEDVLIKNFVDELELSVRSLLEFRTIEYSHKCRDILYPCVRTDNLRVSQICLNLLSNAVKYTPEGGRVSFELWQSPSDKSGYVYMHARVSDTGLGISREFMEEMFSDFARAVDSRVSKIQGTGLGLSIVKQVVDMMDGKIEVESEPGKGSIFHVILPVVIAEYSGETMDPEQEDAFCDIFKGLRVLIAEDNDLNYEIAEELLSEYGMEISRAENGAAALEKLDLAGAGNYDLILMDMQMPIMDGLEATRNIRAIESEYTANIPIIAMTANSFTDDVQACKDAGMNEHIAKPININSLLMTIQTILGRRS